MRTFSLADVESLIDDALAAPRRRKHWNLHQSHEDPCQRLFNAIGVESYIRPHRHSIDGRLETLVAIRGSLALVSFDDLGAVNRIVRIASGRGVHEASIGVEVGSKEWHTVLALEPGSVLLEIKAGPYRSDAAKDYSPWSPEEGSGQARQYLEWLRRVVDEHGSLGARDERRMTGDESLARDAPNRFVPDHGAS